MSDREALFRRLVYSAMARCECGAGLAYEPGNVHGYWDCSAILLGDAIPIGEPGAVTHVDKLPFNYWEVRSENQPSARGRTTRPKSQIIVLGEAGDATPSDEV